MVILPQLPVIPRSPAQPRALIIDAGTKVTYHTYCGHTLAMTITTTTHGAHLDDDNNNGVTVASPSPETLVTEDCFMSGIIDRDKFPAVPEKYNLGGCSIEFHPFGLPSGSGPGNLLTVSGCVCFVCWWLLHTKSREARGCRKIRVSCCIDSSSEKQCNL